MEKLRDQIRISKPSKTFDYCSCYSYMKDFVFDKKRVAQAVLAYSLPGTTEFLLATIGSIECAQIDSRLEAYDFVFAPYHAKSEPKLLFKFQSLASGRKFSITADNTNQQESSTKDAYRQSFEKIKAAIHSQELSKVVLSRRKVISAVTDDLYQQYIDLKNTYPSAFSYLLHIPDYGTWIGASPELLLKADDHNYYTRAVAGTRSKSIGSKLPWKQKDVKEHAFVLTYLREQLNKQNVSYTVSENYTLDTGVVNHICADIEIIRSSELDLAAMITALHPSPALSGYPKEAATEMIAEIEKNDRAYYCGYLGPIDKSRCQLFANIRCMQAYKNGYTLYLGGGIVADSVLEEEWQETEIKAETLLRVITKVDKVSML